MQYPTESAQIEHEIYFCRRWLIANESTATDADYMKVLFKLHVLMDQQFSSENVVSNANMRSKPC